MQVNHFFNYILRSLQSRFQSVIAEITDPAASPMTIPGRTLTKYSKKFGIVFNAFSGSNVAGAIIIIIIRMVIPAVKSVKIRYGFIPIILLTINPNMPNIISIIKFIARSIFIVNTICCILNFL